VGGGVDGAGVGVGEGGLGGGDGAPQLTRIKRKQDSKIEIASLLVIICYQP
jgi:hypothetical protein